MLLEFTMKQTTIRTNGIESNKNISFSIGAAYAVQKYSSKLGFEPILSKYKKRGVSIVGLLEALLTYRLTENLSTSKASSWINQPEVLSEFRIRGFEERTLFRLLDILGSNYEEIIYSIQDVLFSLYDFPHTNTNLDWTSFVLWGKHADIAGYGYSRDHRPDKKQITVGIAELASPINIPFGLTIQPGNTNDQKHFKKSFSQVVNRLKPHSRFVFDKGGQSKENINMVLAGKMKYLSAKKLNKSDDKRIKEFDKNKAELIDAESGVYGIKIVYPSRIDYFYFSERLQQEQTKTKLRRAEQKFREAKEIQQSLDRNRQLPKRFRINNPLVDVTYSYQTKLSSLTEEEALAVVQKASINGREGFFCLVSCENLTLKEALKIYRMKDSVEKIFQSLKNDINIKPLRVWSTNSIQGAVLVGFLAQLIISLMRYDYPQLKQTSPKFIRISLMNLTVTVEKLSKGKKRWIYSNFEPINTLICCQNGAIT
jgi:transposase